jgi:hypothetical protein
VLPRRPEKPLPMVAQLCVRLHHLRGKWHSARNTETHCRTRKRIRQTATSMVRRTWAFAMKATTKKVKPREKIRCAPTIHLGSARRDAVRAIQSVNRQRQMQRSREVRRSASTGGPHGGCKCCEDQPAVEKAVKVISPVSFGDDWDSTGGAAGSGSCSSPHWQFSPQSHPDESTPLSA